MSKCRFCRILEELGPTVEDLKIHIVPGWHCDSVWPQAEYANSLSYNLTLPLKFNGNNKEHYKCGKSLPC